MTTVNEIMALDIEDFFQYVKCIQYGYQDRFGKLHLASDKDFAVVDYYFSSPEEIVKNNCCWCWDLAEFIKLYCMRHDMENMTSQICSSRSTPVHFLQALRMRSIFRKYGSKRSDSNY